MSTEQQDQMPEQREQVMDGMAGQDERERMAMPGEGQTSDVPDGMGSTVDEPGQSQPMSPADGAPPAGEGQDEAEDMADGMEPPD